MSKGDAAVVMPTEVGTQEWQGAVGDFVLKFKEEVDRKSALEKKEERGEEDEKEWKNFPEGCLIPREHMKRFARMAHAESKTFYELCAHKDSCPAADRCQAQGFSASPYENVESRVSVSSPH